MSDSVIICIKILLDVGFSSVLPGNVSNSGLFSRPNRPSCVCFMSIRVQRVWLNCSDCPYARAGPLFTQICCFVLRMYNIQMKVLEGCLGLLRGLISAKYLIQGRRFERNTNVKGLKPPVIITTWKWLITCPLIDLI